LPGCGVTLSGLERSSCQTGEVHEQICHPALNARHVRDRVSRSSRDDAGEGRHRRQHGREKETQKDSPGRDRDASTQDVFPVSAEYERRSFPENQLLGLTRAFHGRFAGPGVRARLYIWCCRSPLVLRHSQIISELERPRIRASSGPVRRPELSRAQSGPAARSSSSLAASSAPWLAATSISRLATLTVSPVAVM
jgi:hypothetical protein